MLWMSAVGCHYTVSRGRIKIAESCKIYVSNQYSHALFYYIKWTLWKIKITCFWSTSVGTVDFCCCFYERLQRWQPARRWKLVKQRWRNKSEQCSLGLSQIYRPIFYFIKKGWDKGNARDARDLYESKILYILVTSAGDGKASSTEKPSNTAW